jgi:hypothetical protein
MVRLVAQGLVRTRRWMIRHLGPRDLWAIGTAYCPGLATRRAEEAARALSAADRREAGASDAASCGAGFATPGVAAGAPGDARRASGAAASHSLTSSGTMSDRQKSVAIALRRIVCDTDRAAPPSAPP